MRRRFGRRRRGGDEARSLDVSRELNRVLETAAVPVATLDAVAEEEVPSTLAAVGIGAGPDGERCVVAVSPESGSAAWLGGVSVGLRLAQTEAFRGPVWALSPHWRAPSRVLLQALRAAPFEVRALATSGEATAEQGARIDAESGASVALSIDLVDRVDSAAAATQGTAVQSRAIEALRGLAAKHGGVLQREGTTLRLVLMGQPVATLGERDLEILRPRRDRVAIAAETLSEAFDQLEGSLRKVLSDRKNRDGEAGLRARNAISFGETLGIATPRLWPLGWGEQCPIDVLGVGGDGQALGAALREELGLGALLPLLEAAAHLAPAASWLLPGTRRGLPGLPIRLVVGAQRIEPAAQRVLEALAPAGAAYTVNIGRSAVSFEPVEALAVAPPSEAAPVARSAPTLPANAITLDSSEVEGEETEAPRPRDREEVPRRDETKFDGEDAADAEERKPARRFEEMSLFDLSEDDEGVGDPGARRRRRRGGRGRNRGGAEGRGRGEASETQARAESVEPTEPAPASAEEPERPRRSRRRRRRRRARPLMVEDVGEEELDEEEETTSEELADREGVSAVGEEDGDDDEESGDVDEDVDALQEDATSAALEATPVAISEAKPSRPVRRRAAIVAQADPVSIGAAVLLARDLRLVEGIWVYEQNDLMTFFRSVATDLGDAVSITVIGFTASPARETIQTASLYRDRLTWYDHHDWPPEDIDAMRQAIGTENVHIVPGSGSSLPLVAAQCTRRSRFSDKFLDLLTGRFSPHDYERWGRLWWWRLRELAKNTGERRRDLDPLLSGRPSDLAREASKRDAPPLPPEAEYVATRDIPLVHFGGYTLLRLVVPAELELTLTARIARERYRAQLVVAAHEGDRAVLLMGDDSNNRRSFNLNAMAEHLASKFGWVETLPGADHVTRFRVTDLLERPERMDEIVAEMAMGRSVLEG